MKWSTATVLIVFLLCSTVITAVIVSGDPTYLWIIFAPVLLFLLFGGSISWGKEDE